MNLKMIDANRLDRIMKNENKGIKYDTLFLIQSCLEEPEEHVADARTMVECHCGKGVDCPSYPCGKPRDTDIPSNQSEPKEEIECQCHLLGDGKPGKCWPCKVKETECEPDKLSQAVKQNADIIGKNVALSQENTVLKGKLKVALEALEEIMKQRTYMGNESFGWQKYQMKGDLKRIEDMVIEALKKIKD